MTPQATSFNDNQNSAPAAQVAPNPRQTPYCAPLHIYYSRAPEIGLAHQGDYTPAEGNP